LRLVCPQDVGNPITPAAEARKSTRGVKASAAKFSLSDCRLGFVRYATVPATKLPGAQREPTAESCAGLKSLSPHWRASEAQPLQDCRTRSQGRWVCSVVRSRAVLVVSVRVAWPPDVLCITDVSSVANDQAAHLACKDPHDRRAGGSLFSLHRLPEGRAPSPRVRLRWKVCYLPWVSFAGSVDVLITSQTRRLT